MPTRLHSFIACALACVAAAFAPISSAAGNGSAAATLIDRATQQLLVDPEATKRDADAAIEALKKQPDPDLEIKARYILCDYYAERDAAAAEHQAALASEQLSRVRRPGLAAGILMCRGQIAEIVGESVRARDYYDRAISAATATNDEEMLAEALYHRGYLLAVQTEYAAGLADLRKAQSLFEKLHQPLYALNSINSIAILFNRMGDYAQAQHLYENALKQQRANGMRRDQAVTLYNLGRAHENLMEWDAARDSYARSHEISRELGYPRGEAYALYGLAVVANAKNDPTYALEMLQRASELQQQTVDARLDAQIQLARGIALRKLRNLPAGLTALERAMQVFRQTDALRESSATFAELALVNADMGNWRAAYDYQTQSQSTMETLLRNQRDQRFATLKVEFDTAAKEKENELLTRENKLNTKAIAEGVRARKLQATVIAMAALITVLLIALAIHQRRVTRRMQTLAMTDELTGMPNRRSVLNRLAALLDRENRAPCSILVVDIDHFKSINDRFGHPVGDEALRLVAHKLSETLREPAFIGRLGGEEFVIVLPDTALERAIATAERLREEILAIEARRLLYDRQITVSIGATVSTPGRDTTSTMLKRADSALYAAKYAGRNCVRSEPALTAALATRVA